MSGPENPDGSAECIAGRYEVCDRLGKGGMAAVERVYDHSTHTELALKRLLPSTSPDKHQKAWNLFEREYHTLSQLSHPRVVRVYDYGVDGDTAYYTMELLDGGDLHGRTPLDWATACAFMRDVCSVLALLHSRRLVHRDIGPRNIRCTTDGLAKLIDFGAMVPMGAGKQPVGTPPLVPPEAVDMETLDARTDLYSVGATLYFALTGKNAYPARTFSKLRTAWNTPPRRPSELVPDIPTGLDALVMSLLSLDPADRPSNAAEVMERLGTIAELPSDEQLHVSHAYLSTPTLVARDGLLARARAKLERARRERGSALLVVGETGAGRSRFLDACLLEAKFGGATVVRVDAAESNRGEYGAVRGLAGRLRLAHPDLARSCAEQDRGVLGGVIPELWEDETRAHEEHDHVPSHSRATVQQALRRWLVTLSKEQPLVVGVDDVDRLDEPSAALIALLAHEARNHRIAVVATAEQDAAKAHFGPLRLLSDESTELPLPRLRQQETEELLRGVFGDVPYLQILGNKLQEISKGNPRDVMELAQHLVDKGTIRYESGTWLLPAEIDDTDLPDTIAKAFTERVRTLGADSLDLAQPWALAPELSMNHEDLQTLSSHGDPARMTRALNELLTSGVVRGHGHRFELAQRGWVAPLLGAVPETEARTLHQRLSAFFATRGDEFRAAQHSLRAGDVDRGIDALLAHAISSSRETRADPDAYARLVASMPSDWLETYEYALEQCRVQERPLHDIHMLLDRMTSLDRGRHAPDALAEFIQQLTWASGLDLYETLDASMDPKERLDKTLQLAQQRYEKTPVAERICEPTAAIRPLAQACVLATGATGRDLNFQLWSSVPSLAPFEPLSPAIHIINMLLQGLGKRITAHTREAISIYEDLLERANQPDRAGLEETYHHYTVFGVLCGLGLIEAPIGIDKALERAAAIEDDPSHRVDAVVIRMLHHLAQGRAHEAQECKQKVEVLRLENSLRQWFEGGHLMGELTAHAAADDLVRIRQVLADVAVMAEKFTGWVPVFHYGKAEYHRTRGAYAAALQELEVALPLAPPGQHQLWGEIAAAHVRVLDRLGRSEDAVNHGEDYMAAAAVHQLGYQTNFIRMVHAVALAHTDHRAQAEAIADEAIRRLDELEAGTLLRGLAHEARARVASHFGDERVFEEQARACAALFKDTSNPALSAKYKRLVDDAHQARLDIPDTLFITMDHTTQHSLRGRTLTSELEKIPNSADQARTALDILVQEGGATGGALYAVTSDGPILEASHNLPDEISGLDDMVRDELAMEMSLADHTVTADADVTMAARPKGIQSGEMILHPVPIAHSANEGFCITGMVVLMLAANASWTPPTECVTELSRYWHTSGIASCLDPQKPWLQREA